MSNPSTHSKQGQRQALSLGKMALLCATLFQLAGTALASSSSAAVKALQQKVGGAQKVLHASPSPSPTTLCQPASALARRVAANAPVVPVTGNSYAVLAPFDIAEQGEVAGDSVVYARYGIESLQDRRSEAITDWRMAGAVYGLHTIPPAAANSLGASP
jgi:hypothetical protein